MIRHHRVQMPPVAMSAPLCVRESDSGGRVKSVMVTATSIHCGASAVRSWPWCGERCLPGDNVETGGAIYLHDRGPVQQSSVSAGVWRWQLVGREGHERTKSAPSWGRRGCSTRTGCWRPLAPLAPTPALRIAIFWRQVCGGRSGRAGMPSSGAGGPCGKAYSDGGRQLWM